MIILQPPHADAYNKNKRTVYTDICRGWSREEGPQDIGKKLFIHYVQDWVDDFVLILEEERRTDIKIEVATLTTALRERIKKPDFPIAVILWTHLKTAIDQLPSTTTAEGFRSALLQGFIAFKTEMGSDFVLTNHFKHHQATYRNIKKRALNEQVMIANDFETWFVEILDVARKRQQASEEAQEALQYAFQVAYGKWLADQRRQVLHMILAKEGTYTVHANTKDKFITKLLKKCKEWQKIQPELAQEITQKIRAELQHDGLDINDYGRAMGIAYTNITTPETIIAAHWYQHKHFFDIAELITTLAAGE